MALHHNRLMLGAEFCPSTGPAQRASRVGIPTSLSYLARWRPGTDIPLTLELGFMQVAGNLGSGFAIEARHQVVVGVVYHF